MFISLRTNFLLHPLLHNLILFSFLFLHKILYILTFYSLILYLTPISLQLQLITHCLHLLSFLPAHLNLVALPITCLFHLSLPDIPIDILHIHQCPEILFKPPHLFYLGDLLESLNGQVSSRIFFVTIFSSLTLYLVL